MKNKYVVAKGVDFINGKKVTDKIVELTAGEALYDLALGRIAAQSKKAQPLPKPALSALEEDSKGAE